MTDAKGQGKSVEKLFPCPFFTAAETGQCKSNGSLYAAHHLWEEAAKRLKGQIKGQTEKKVRNLTVSDFSWKGATIWIFLRLLAPLLSFNS